MTDTARRRALVTMLDMQHRMNTRVNADWIAQGFAWYRAIWIECGELMEHYGYKWWKKHQPDMEQVRLEVVDIWHFGMSALFDGRGIEEIAAQIDADIRDHRPIAGDVRAATESLAAHALNERGFSVPRFWDLLLAAGLDFDSLYRHYVGKNVLNFFRQDHGYQEGTYTKQWQGREDNEHLSELIEQLDSGSEHFAEQLYDSLGKRYRQATS
jgi:hypothetical protein